MGDIQLEVAWNLPLILAGENNDMILSLKVSPNSLARLQDQYTKVKRKRPWWFLGFVELLWIQDTQGHGWGQYWLHPAVWSSLGISFNEMPNEMNWMVFFLASVGQINWRGWKSGIFMGKLTRNQDGAEMRGEYYGETVFHGSLEFLQILPAEVWTALCSRLSFQGYLCSKSPWMIQIMSPWGAKGR